MGEGVVAGGMGPLMNLKLAMKFVTFALFVVVSLAMVPASTVAAGSAESSSDRAVCPPTSRVWASSSASNAPPALAFDCNLSYSSMWNSGGYSGTLYAQFVSPITFAGVLLTANATPPTDETYVTSVSSDGVNWTQLAQSTQLVSASGSALVVTLKPIRFGPVTQEYLRIQVDGGASWVGIDEVQLLVAGDTSGFTWNPRAPLPTPRELLRVVTASNGWIYAIGGATQNNATPLATVEAYNPATNVWTTEASLPRALYAVGATVTSDGKIYVAGGITGPGGIGNTSAVEVYDASTNSWASRASLPVSIADQGLVAARDGLIYSVDGWTNGPVNSVYAYDPKKNMWATRTGAPTARADLAAAEGSDGLIYVVGGDQGVDSPPVGTLEAYDPQTDSWSSRASMPMPREHLAAAAIPGKIVVLGGDGTASCCPQSSVEVYDLATNQWTTQTSLPIGMADLGATYVPARGIFAIGGFDSSGATLPANYEARIGSSF